MIRRLPSGRAVAKRIKVTPGITGLSFPRDHIDEKDWHLDVGSSHPGGEATTKGWAVRPLKRNVSWVQNVGILRLIGSNVSLVLANIGETFLSKYKLAERWQYRGKMGLKN